MKKLLLKNWRDLKAKKAQFFTITLLIGLGISAYVALIFAYLNLNESYSLAKEKLKLADFNVSVVEATTTVAPRIRKIEGVKAVEGRFILDTGLVVDKKRRGSARVITVPGGRRLAVNRLLLDTGKYLTGEDDQQILVDKYFADTAKKKPGDKIKLIINGQEESFKIRGVVVSPEYLFPIRSKEELPVPGQIATVFISQEEVSFRLGRPLTFNDFAVLLEKQAHRGEVSKRVKKVLAPFKIIRVTKQEDQPSNFRLLEEIRQNRESASFMPPLILIISSLSLYIALSRLVQSQRGIIGLAKALGYSNIRLLLHYLFFALLVAVGGLLLGFTLGWYLGYQIIKVYVAFLRLPFLTSKVYWQQLKIAALLAFVTALLGAAIPAYTSAKLLPATAMRADPNLLITRATVPLLEQVLGKLFRIPFLLKLSLRNIFRLKKRSFYTIIGLVFALILTVGTWSSFDSIDYLISRQFRLVDKWDMAAPFSHFVSDTQVKQIKEIKGVKQVWPTLQIPVRLAAHGSTHETVITAMNPKAKFHGFSIVKGEKPRAALAQNGIIIPQRIAKKLRLKLGDKVVISSPYSQEKEVVKLLAVSEELLGAPIFVNLKIGRQLTDSQQNLYNFFYLKVERSLTGQLEERLFAKSGVSQVMVKSRLLASIEAQLEFASTSFLILLAFALSVAFVITYNTLTTNVIERTREIATMRTIGEDNLYLAVAVTLENLFLALAGIPIGIYLGLQATKAMFASFSTEAYTLKAILYPLSYLWVILSVLVVILISEVPAVRRIFTLNLAEATKAIE